MSALVLMLRFHGVAVEVEQLRHQIGVPSVGSVEMLRAARALGLKARMVSSNWARLAKAPLPAIAQRKDGTFVVLAKVAGDKALIQDPLSGRPEQIERAHLEADWTGRLLLMARRARFSDLARKFDVSWFLRARGPW
ncbi:cysteine peptidase family C39 domain-containing protein [Xanthobacter autotrophicus]|uniref:cysteine peptidase family C39 domain-containing protein n=1 Tax=Xanthobacter autotrophicus TaxID=280 RepID=UPI00372CC48A